MHKFSRLILLLFILFHLNSFAQNITKWKEIFGDSVKTVYLDTTSVRISETQMICWILERFNNGITVKSVPEKVFKQKQQIIFNIPRKHFNILGSLYYNKIRLIGDSYSQNLVGAGGVFSKPIEMNPIIKNVYRFLVQNYLQNSSYALLTQQSDSSAEVVKLSNEGALNPDSQKNKPEKINVTDSIFANNINPIKNKENKKEVSLITSQPSVSSAFSGNINLANVTSEVIPKVKTTPPATKIIYNKNKEHNVTRTIFTDGNFFTVQVSSWKSKRYALRQVKKIKKMGYNAFIVSVYIKKFRGFWNRVRVGYFKSLKEAKKIQRELKRKLK